MSNHRPGRIASHVLRAPGYLYEWHLGWLLGHRFLRLTHVGRRSGQEYRTMLEVVARTDAGEYVVIAGLGRAADWYRNIQTTPAVEVAVGAHAFRAVQRTLSKEQAVAVFADYERRNRYVAPIIRRVLSWLVGWNYDASASARVRLAETLPAVAFGPDQRGAEDSSQDTKPV